MWCANCQDDVATEISTNGQALKCITCGEDVRQVFAPSLHPETKSARDLLQKWAEEQKQQIGKASEPPSSQQPSAGGEERGAVHPEHSPVAEESVVGEPEAEPSADATHKLDQSSETESQSSQYSDSNSATESTAESKKNQPVFRVDTAHEQHSSRKPYPEVQTDIIQSEELNAVAETQQTNKTSSTMTHDKSTHNENQSQAYNNHLAHEHMPAPHFDVSAASKRAKSRPGRSEAIWGQLMAYAGVGVLTVGTIMVLWGYFGMVEQYASTGWLLSTAGQMLLLLGIVTLVSGGMQQTTHEVTERIEYLGGRMIRIEQSTDELLNGPHFMKQKADSENVSEVENNSNSV